jgi:hypothetical protein
VFRGERRSSCQWVAVLGAKCPTGWCRLVEASSRFLVRVHRSCPLRLAPPCLFLVLWVLGWLPGGLPFFLGVSARLFPGPCVRKHWFISLGPLVGIFSPVDWNFILIPESVPPRPSLSFWSF